MDRTVNLTKANQPRFHTPILMESRCGRFSRESYRQARHFAGAYLALAGQFAPIDQRYSLFKTELRP